MATIQEQYDLKAQEYSNWKQNKPEDPSNGLGDLSFSASGTVRITAITKRDRFGIHYNGFSRQVFTTQSESTEGPNAFQNLYIEPGYTTKVYQQKIDSSDSDTAQYIVTTYLDIFDSNEYRLKHITLGNQGYYSITPKPEDVKYSAITYLTDNRLYEVLNWTFEISSGNPPGYSRTTPPPPPPPPPPPVCDVKIGIDESLNTDGNFCMSFEEFERFKQNNKRAEENLDSTINVLQGLN